MEKRCTSIVWFRRDLRIEDNPALASAAGDGKVLPVFVWCPNEETQYYPGRVSRWWLKQSLLHLQRSLKLLGAELVLIKAESTFSALLECAHAVGATKVVYNRLYDPISVARDHDIKQKLSDLGINMQSYNGDLLLEPWEVSDDNERSFTKFSAYWEKSLDIHKERELVVHLPLQRLVPASGKVKNIPIETLGLEIESEKSSNALLGRAWSPGWAHADKALTEFIEKHLPNYLTDYQNVGGNYTSLLSPHLHFGELSIRKLYQHVLTKQILWKNEKNRAGEISADHFLKSIGLREYARYICFNFPFTHERSLLSGLKYFPWDSNELNFKAWRQGRTGYPLVDAGMRELWATGWIHNKIRVIVSSFLVKFLRLPWQWGMKYFWDTLLDADLENDVLGWQYISGSLPDGHVLERMDNPEILGFKFDAEGDYVRLWLPELVKMPTEYLHHPWDAPFPVLETAGVELGINYPKPIIDEELARVKLTEAILAMREKANGTDEVVFDNTDTEINLSTRNENGVETESVQCPDGSEMKDLNIMFREKKRLKSVKMDGDLCSTAESSSNKKHTREGEISSVFVPLNCSSISTNEVDRGRGSREEMGAEEMSRKNDVTGLQTSENRLFDEKKSL